MTTPPRNEDPARCMKCGFCMSVCPVYGEDFKESHVARGRNMLIQTARDGELPMSDNYRDSLSYCLLCKRCEAVCPARLSPVQITLQARREMIDKSGLTWMQRMVNRALTDHRSALARLIGVIGLLPGFASSGKRPLRHMADVAAIFSKSLQLPSLSAPRLSDRVKRVTPPTANTGITEQVAIFPGCIAEYFQADIGQMMISSLASAGYTVVYPEKLNCCGLAVHSAGDFKTAQMLAAKNITALSGYTKIVTGCATCSSALKSYGNWFPEESVWYDEAVSLSAKIVDFSELMTQTLDLNPIQPIASLSVTYHDPCHLKQHQGIADAPRKILSAIPGITFIEMNHADACCGLGGSFGISHQDISRAMQNKKIDSIRQSGAQAVVTSCPGCMMYLKDGISRQGLDVRVLHIAQLMSGNQTK